MRDYRSRFQSITCSHGRSPLVSSCKTACCAPGQGHRIAAKIACCGQITKLQGFSIGKGRDQTGLDCHAPRQQAINETRLMQAKHSRAFIPANPPHFNIPFQSLAIRPSSEPAPARQLPPSSARLPCSCLTCNCNLNIPITEIPISALELGCSVGPRFQGSHK
jgi:hypothetical protein